MEKSSKYRRPSVIQNFLGFVECIVVNCISVSEASFNRLATSSSLPEVWQYEEKYRIWIGRLKIAVLFIMHNRVANFDYFT